MGNFNTTPWLQSAFDTAGAQPTGPFTPGEDKSGTRRDLGTIGDYAVGQIDVRTPFMQALEKASQPLLFNLLTNPQGISAALGQAGGQVPQAPRSNLANMIFGGSGSPQQPQTPQTPPSGPPVAGGPLSGQTPGSPIPQGGPFDELGKQIPPQQVDPFNVPGSLQQQILQFAQGLGNNDGSFWQQPLQNWGEGGQLGDLFGALNSGGQFAGNSAYANRQPTVGTGTDVLSQLLTYNPNIRNNGFNLDQAGTQSLASQIWPQLPGGAQNHAVSNLASIAGGGGQQPTIQSFLESIGFKSHAAGGILDPNAFNIVGEQGPEIIPPANMFGQQQVIPNMNMGTNSAQASSAGMLGNALFNNPEQEAFNQTSQILRQQGGGMAGPTAANPEQDVFAQMRQLLMQQGGILGSGGGGQAVVQAMQPIFTRNLQDSLGQLNRQSPSVFGSGIAQGGTDIAQRANQDFNLQAMQALQQGQQNTLGAMGLMGQLAGQAGQGQFGRQLAANQQSQQGLGILNQSAGQAGNGQFNRMLGAGNAALQQDLGYGQLGLQANQQQWEQTINPTLQLLMAALGMATPTAFQTVIPGKK